ncbi:MAG TPA: alpha/beta hydrolase, partial [Myxococcota bacterium]|nr:alpha/beta hydrolase [Myxococcota bacterium]
ALRQIRAPALIVATRGDPGHPLSTAERLAELLPHATLHVVESFLELGSARAELARFLEAAPR